jgi:selT/selW/selH-like putative selenoprotein
LAAEIKNKFGIEAELIRSGGGVFEIKKDGDLIFSKRKLGRFPEDSEVFDLLAK